jgi:hypothetical protein
LFVLEKARIAIPLLSRKTRSLSKIKPAASDAQILALATHYGHFFESGFTRVRKITESVYEGDA